ncbi:phosphatase PAP2 family protein [Streptomyces monticola]|uniref:Phosphatase PAP2 family protein n=1 Tax=Streptomyces monticola TaxID=2666263 RepID=A0ABW2JQV0_9ACTN
MHSAPQDSAAPPRPRPSGALTATALTLAALSALLLGAVVAAWPPLLDLDGTLARTTHRWAVADPTATHANRILTDWFWDPWTMRILCAVLVGRLWWRGDRGLAVWAGAACLVGTLAQQVLKAVVGRDRPSWPDPVDSAHYAAFPSGHAMTAVVVGGLFLWVFARIGIGGARWHTALAVTVVSVVGVGATRVWLGVHWPSDVVGGWLLGALTVVLAMLLYARYGVRESAAERAHVGRA